MSDFLNNLALRSLGSAETVQPRLPALFEQPQPTAGLLFAPGPALSERAQGQLKEILVESDSEAMSVSDHVSSLSAGDLVAARRSSDGLSSQKHAKAASLEPAATQSTAGLHSPAPMPSSSLLPQSLVSYASAQLSEPQSDGVERFAARSSRAGKDEAESGRHLRDTEIPYKSVSEPLRSSAEAGPDLPVVQIPVKPLAARSDAPYSVAADLPFPLRQIIESRLAPQSQTATPAASSRRSNSSEPTVHVTIGRIEVRATPQQTSTSRARSASPVMSLDEYLRRRSKRGGE